jgi:hypothetical protein
LTEWKNEEFLKEFFFDKSNHDYMNIRLKYIKRIHF